MRTKLRRLIILAFGGVLIVGAACGSGGDSKEATASDTGSADATTVTTAAAGGGVGQRDADCNILKLEDIEGAFGAGFTPIEDTSRSGTIICGTNRPSDVVSVSYTIKPTSAGEYDATIDYAVKSGSRKEEPSEKVGDKATRLVREQYGITVVQVMAVKGNALFYVTMSAQDGAISMQAEGLAKTLGERL